MSKDEAEKALREMDRSINTREKELNRLGSEAGHEERLKREKAAREEFKESMRRQQYDEYADNQMTLRRYDYNPDARRS
ncbi:hypothetical protein [Nonomuraea sp. NPDC003201]